MTDALTDPNTVHVNMLAGRIAKPSPAQIWHIYGAELLAAMPTPDAAGIVERLREMGEHPCRAHLPMGADLREAATTIAAQAAELQRLREALPNDLRADGWAVAVHNDYRLNGEHHTFWLFTKGDRCVKGEGKTDAEALAAARNLTGAPCLTARNK